MSTVLKDFAETVDGLEIKYLMLLKSNLSRMFDNLEFKINTDNTKKVILTKIMLIDQKLLNLSKG